MIQMTDFGRASEETRGAAFNSWLADPASEKIVQNGRKWNSAHPSEADFVMAENVL